MRIEVFFTLYLGTCAGAPLFASPQDLPSKSAIEQQFTAEYHSTNVDTQGTVIPPAGSVLIIQEEKLRAIPSSWHGYYWSSSYKSGGIPRQGIIQNVPGGLPPRSDQREFQVGEKVYLTSLEIRGSEVVFRVQSCGNCDPGSVQPNYIPFRAGLTFQFPKGFLEVANFKQIRDTIGQVFGVDNSPSDPVTQIPQPPLALVVEPKSVEVGQTTDQVVGLLGKPESILKLGAKEIYRYKDIKITFVDGKMTDAQ